MLTSSSTRLLGTRQDILGRLELQQLVVCGRARQRDELRALARPLSRMDKCRLLVRLLQLNVKARLAHSASFAAVALQEVMTAGRTIELRAVHCTAV
jgi:hypothetical protein